VCSSDLAAAVGASDEEVMAHRIHGKLHVPHAVRLGTKGDRRREDQLRTLLRQASHRAREVTVVADRHADRARLGLEDGRALVPGRLVALFVKAGVLGNVDHARHTKQRAVGIDHR